MRGTFARFWKITGLLFGVFCLPFSGFTQEQPFELSWRTGTAILTNGDTIQGPLTLTLPNDILRIKQADGAVRTFPALSVSSFSVRDEQNAGVYRNKIGPLEMKRQYQVYAWNHDKDYSNFKSPAFFAVLQPGKHTLLMRETREWRQDHTGGYATGGRMDREVIVQKFYLAMPDEKIVALRSPKRDLLSLFPNQQKQIADFAKANKLSFSDPIELSRIVAYANSLF